MYLKALALSQTEGHIRHTDTLPDSENAQILRIS